ncbi:MAG: hypothetical protein A2Y70_02020 [Candidatus Aminicenantes bacterium RBG_13_64_14]|nr:MAG: hypothetical protein A2Y70_02020 [Candidatus Aminicenantes bacterium RBG_13_64_14]
MPFPSVHSCRLREPGEFEKGSIRTKSSGRVLMILGRLKGQPTMTAQAIHYPKSDWTASEAAADCRSRKGRFEAASSGETQETALPDHLNPDRNKIIKLGKE